MDGFERARRRIEEFQMNRPQVIYCMVPTGPTAPTGPTGGITGPTGPTERLFKSSNRIIINSS